MAATLMRRLARARVKLPDIRMPITIIAVKQNLTMIL